jgi:hypothetical protein
MPPDRLTTGRSGNGAGELARRPVREGREPRALQQPRDPALALGAVVAEQPAEEVDVLEHRERRIEVPAEALRHVGDARADRPAVARIGHVGAEHLDPAGLHRARPRDQREQARLADAVGTDQPDHAAGGKVEAHRIEGADPAVAQADLAQPRDRRRRRGVRRVAAHRGSRTRRSSGHSRRGSRRT